MQDLAPGAFLCQYFGELVSEEEARKKEEEGAAPGYCFLLGAQAGRGCCLDSRRYGNVARFLNHSCLPNLVALPVFTGLEVPGVAFFAGSRGVRAGEELGFDYGDDFWAVQRSRGVSCLCGEAVCRYSDTREAPPPREAPPRGFAFKTLRAPPIAKIHKKAEKKRRGLGLAPPPRAPAGQ
ncbi:histone-lysine N-methyltransferase EHMT1-like [Anolis sagrei]|uniref:histone-lysine N-methyltransferase EHMT1-like n=1 Tax=Anolis sagrei TaxID=38937 RepID=UPI00351FCA07